MTAIYSVVSKRKGWFLEKKDLLQVDVNELQRRKVDKKGKLEYDDEKSRFNVKNLILSYSFSFGHNTHPNCL